jgi:hypothetical protein
MNRITKILISVLVLVV